jgi:hypothetical protein
MAVNYKDILTQGAALPVAIEAKLPTGAPKVSAVLNDITSKLPTAPNFPIVIPDLPPVPTFPELPVMPGAGTSQARRPSRAIRLIEATPDVGVRGALAGGVATRGTLN